MLSPIQDSVFTTSTTSMSGHLAEMERVIGDSISSGYVGYNGRAPGSTYRRDSSPGSTDRNRGRDVRRTLVAYFEIDELASVLSVERATVILAVEMFKETSVRINLRNRSVESLGAACFKLACDKRCEEYDAWLKKKEGSGDPNVEEGQSSEQHTTSINQEPQASDTSDVEPMGPFEGVSYREDLIPSRWATIPKRVSTQEVAKVAQVEIDDLHRYLRIASSALNKDEKKTLKQFATQMPDICELLHLPDETRKLAIAIAEKASAEGICTRRNPISVIAAAIYYACQLDGVRKTQTEICRQTSVTEVTLRKVYKELNQENSALLPSWYKKAGIRIAAEASRPQEESPSQGQQMQSSQEASSGAGRTQAKPAMTTGPNSTVLGRADSEPSQILLGPPPLPPGFGRMPEIRVDIPLPPPPPLPLVFENNATPAQVGNIPRVINTTQMQPLANILSRVPQIAPPPIPPPLPSVQPSAPERDDPAHGQRNIGLQPTVPAAQSAHRPDLSEGEPRLANRSTDEQA